MKMNGEGLVKRGKEWTQIQGEMLMVGHRRRKEKAFLKRRKEWTQIQAECLWDDKVK
jgi:hypothetical protein